MPKVEKESPAKKETPIIDDKSNIDFLKLFQGLGHQAVEDMAESIEWIDLVEGQVLFRKGDAAEAMYVVQDGLLLASSTEEGCAPAMVGQMGPGSLVGEIALLTGGRRSATVTAAEKTRLARLDASDLKTIMARYPEMKRAFLDIARQRLRRSQWLKILSEYFGEIDKDKYEFIESRFEWVHVNRGETLFSKGDAADGLYFLVHGFLHAVSQEASGEAKILGAILSRFRMRPRLWAEKEILILKRRAGLRVPSSLIAYAPGFSSRRYPFSRNRAKHAETTSASKSTPLFFSISSSAAPIPKAGRYGRWEAMASTTSATAMILDSRRIFSPTNPLG